MKTILTLEELAKQYPEKPKGYGLRYWLSRLILSLIISISCWMLCGLILFDTEVVFNLPLMCIVLFFTLIFSTSPLDTPVFLNKLFKIHDIRMKLQEWEILSDQYDEYQEYLKLKSEYEPSKIDNFEDLLESEINKLPYTKHVDDGQFNDGQVSGFEQGARWCKELFS